MKQYTVPLFVPFNIRNKIINDSKKDIDNYSIPEQAQVLFSYMKEKQIFQNLEKKNHQNLRNNLPLYKMGINHGFSIMGKFETVERYYQSMGIKNVGMIGTVTPTSISDTGLKAYWKFNEASGVIINQSASAVDLGAAADGTVTGMTYNQASGPFNYSGLFDGVDDKVVIGSSLSQFNFMHSTTALSSLNFWMKLVSTTGTTGIFGNQSGTITPGYHLQRYGNRMELTIYNASNQATLSLDPTANFVPDTTTWYMYTMTHDQSLGSANGIAYRDAGNSVSADKTANTPSNADAANAMEIGRSIKNNAFTNAYISEMSVWNKVLSSSDISLLYNGGSGRQIY